MPTQFFPGVAFAWAFVGLLGAGLTVAAVVDGRTRRIPKTITLGIAGGGLLCNSVRGGLLGWWGQATWKLGPGGVAWGALDGLLFAAAGLLGSFAVFFIFWLFGTCGGGDVKLFAAVGAWVGLPVSLFVLAAAVLVVGAISLFRSLRQAWTGGGKPKSTARARLLTFSLPLAVATAAVVAVFHGPALSGKALGAPAEARQP